MLFNKNTFLIIGGTGFIGHALAKKLIDKGNEVYSFSQKNPKVERKISKVIYLKGSIKNLSNLKKVFKKKNFDHVVNCGGYVEHKDKKEIEVCVSSAVDCFSYPLLRIHVILQK